MKGLVSAVLWFSPTDIGFLRMDIVTFPIFTVYAVHEVKP